MAGAAHAVAVGTAVAFVAGACPACCCDTADNGGAEAVACQDAAAGGVNPCGIAAETLAAHDEHTSYLQVAQRQNCSPGTTGWPQPSQATSTDVEQLDIACPSVGQGGTGTAAAGTACGVATGTACAITGGVIGAAPTLVAPVYGSKICPRSTTCESRIVDTAALSSASACRRLRRSRHLASQASPSPIRATMTPPSRLLKSDLAASAASPPRRVPEDVTMRRRRPRRRASSGDIRLPYRPPRSPKSAREIW